MLRFREVNCFFFPRKRETHPSERRQPQLLRDLDERGFAHSLKAAFHDTDTDILARIVARKSVSVSWNAALTNVLFGGFDRPTLKEETA